MSYITNLKVENCKKITHISFQPGVGIVEVGGPCAEGKSSLEDAILYAFGGEKVIPSMPLRHGATKGKIEITESNGHVTTRKLGKGAGLEVKNEKGFPLSKPQQVCNDKIGSLIFDPLAFSRMKPTEQREKIIELTGVDFSEMDYERDQVFEERTLINREVEKLSARLDAIPEISEPPVEVNVVELLDELNQRQEYNAAGQRAQQAFERIQQEYTDIKNQITALQLKLQQKEDEGRKLSEEVRNFQPQDAEEVRSMINNANEINAKAQAYGKRQEIAKDLEAKESQAQQMTSRIEEIDALKKRTLAETPFPVPGLSFNETEVLYNGVPLSQASGAEQVIISAAIGMALSPDPDKLQIMIVREGGLLDDAKRLELYKLVRHRGFQLFIEQPGVDGDIVIVNGAIADEGMKAEAIRREAEAREMLKGI